MTPNPTPLYTLLVRETLTLTLTLTDQSRNSSLAAPDGRPDGKY